MLKKLAIILVLILITVSLTAKNTLKASLVGKEGVKYYRAKQYERAIQQFSLALRYDDTLDWLYFWKGISFYKLRDYAKARVWILKATKFRKKKGYYNWLAAIAHKLGNKEEEKLFRKYYKNPPLEEVKQYKAEHFFYDYHQKGLRAFNKYQRILGNELSKIDDRLNSAAKAHAEYIATNRFYEQINLQWHYQEKGKKGYIGVMPYDQARAFGFKASKGFFVGNTMIGWTTWAKYTEPEYLFEHLASTIYHRSMVVSPGFEAIGLYRLQKGRKKLLVYFYSHKSSPKGGKIMLYPAENQRDVLVKMLPEIPNPFPGDSSVGFPISIQNFTKDSMGVPVLVDAWLKDEYGRKVSFYVLSSKNAGTAGQLMRSLKMLCIAAKDPLKPQSKYTVYLKAKDLRGNIIFDKEWSFRTR